MTMISTGVQVNPAASTILADTGALANDVSGLWDVIVSSSAGVGVVFEHVGTDGTTVVASHLFPVAANGLVPGLEFNVQALAGQRLRLRTTTLVALGNVQGTFSTGAV